MTLSRAACLWIASMLAGCSAATPPPVSRFDAWTAAHPADVEAYAAFLRSQGVAGVIPMQELLRSGRRWKSCGAEEFAMPPRARWNAMPATLKLVHELRQAGVIDAPVAASAYRTPGYKRCEGGSLHSRHLTNNALDFDLQRPADARLCDWWRRHGGARGFGLGFYAPNRIHIDTSGFRTWGSDHTRATSLCRGGD